MQMNLKTITTVPIIPAAHVSEVYSGHFKNKIIWHQQGEKSIMTYISWRKPSQINCWWKAKHWDTFLFRLFLQTPHSLIGCKRSGKMATLKVGMKVSFCTHFWRLSLWEKKCIIWCWVSWLVKREHLILYNFAHTYENKIRGHSSFLSFNSLIVLLGAAALSCLPQSQKRPHKPPTLA